jgi:hypothetical protein
MATAPMATASGAAGVVKPTPRNAEEAAKRAWLARQELPAWGTK